jgi:hypothetical protein
MRSRGHLQKRSINILLSPTYSWKTSAKEACVESPSARFQGSPCTTCSNPKRSHLQLHLAKDPEAALFKRLDGLQPAEVTRLEPGEHVFAVYGENIFLQCT